MNDVTNRLQHGGDGFQMQGRDELEKEPEKETKKGWPVRWDENDENCTAVNVINSSSLNKILRNL